MDRNRQIQKAKIKKPEIRNIPRIQMNVIFYSQNLKRWNFIFSISLVFPQWEFVLKYALKIFFQMKSFLKKHKILLVLPLKRTYKEFGEKKNYFIIKLSLHLMYVELSIHIIPMAESFIAVCDILLKFNNLSAKFVCNFNK